jgi:hypothetical protein
MFSIVYWTKKHSAMRATGMARFIRVEFYNGDYHIDVNVDHIEMYHVPLNGEKDPPTLLRLASGERMGVKQSPADIRLLIEQTEQYRSP